MLAHWNNSPQIDMLLHSGTLFWFRANQSLLLLLNAACLAEKNTNFIVFGLTRPGFESTIYHTPGQHANHYTTDAVISLYKTIRTCIHTYKKKLLEILQLTFLLVYYTNIRVFISSDIVLPMVCRSIKHLHVPVWPVRNQFILFAFYYFQSGYI